MYRVFLSLAMLLAYSRFNPAARIILALLSSSARRNAVSCSGVPGDNAPP